MIPPNPPLHLAMSELICAGRALGRLLRRIPLEAVVWMVGLAAMASFDPRADTLETWCLFNRVFGLESCPGCGLGHSIAFLARGEWAAAVQAHPLGIPAVGIIGAHVGRLLHDAYAPRSRAWAGFSRDRAPRRG